MFQNEKVRKMRISDIIIDTELNPLARIGDAVSKGALKTLTESFKTIGQNTPIIINGDKKLLSGARRLKAAEYAGWSEVNIVTRTVEKAKQMLISIDDQMEHSGLNDYQTALALTLHEQYWHELYPTSRPNVRAGLASQGINAPKSHTTIAAEEYGVSEKSIQLAKARIKKSSSKVKQAYKNGELNSSKVNVIATLSQSDQDLIIPFAKGLKYQAVKALVEKANTAGIEVALKERSISDNDAEMYHFSSQLSKTIVMLEKFITAKTPITDQTIKKKMAKLKSAIIALNKFGVVVRPSKPATQAEVTH